jgi:hypothetical protein
VSARTTSPPSGRRYPLAPAGHPGWRMRLRRCG